MLGKDSQGSVWLFYSNGSLITIFQLKIYINKYKYNDFDSLEYGNHRPGDNTCSHINIWKRSYIHQNLIKKLIKYIPICFKKNVKSINSVLNTSSLYRFNIITGTRRENKATSKQIWREPDVIWFTFNYYKTMINTC